MHDVSFDLFEKWLNYKNVTFLWNWYIRHRIIKLLLLYWNWEVFFLAMILSCQKYTYIPPSLVQLPLVPIKLFLIWTSLLLIFQVFLAPCCRRRGRVSLHLWIFVWLDRSQSPSNFRKPKFKYSQNYWNFCWGIFLRCFATLPRSLW